MLKRVLSLVFTVMAFALCVSCASNSGALQGNLVKNQPSESITTGSQQNEDIVIHVESPYESRRCITDKDIEISMIFINLSGINYIADKAILEMKSENEWVNVAFQHANLGMIYGWATERDLLFLYESLAAGEYRLRLDMNILNGIQETKAEIEPVCEFAVIAYNDASAPAWEKSRLKQSPYNTAGQTTSVRISFANPVLNNENPVLGYVITSDIVCYYGASYIVDVLLDGTWYRAPLTNAIVPSILLMFDPDDTDSNNRTEFDPEPVPSFGILPAGTYRLIKEFDLGGARSSPTYLGTEEAVAEFTVEETIEWNGLYQPVRFEQ
ncbi:MAG: hypothetical protein LBH28_07860 [Oscillospiraceae bacterium]|jgi:hypothetical protein|nr:hypothetical protein [Oscillospiraceae bacterium]